MNIIIKINLEIPLSLLKKPKLDIFAALKKQLEKIKENYIMAVRKLLNNNFLIIVSSLETCKKFKENLYQTKTLIIKSRIITTNQIIIIYFIPKSINKTNPKLFLEKIIYKNRIYHSNFNFKRFLWPRTALVNKKIYRLIILEFGSLKEANIAIKKGIIYQAEKKDCELYSDKYK